MGKSYYKYWCRFSWVLVVCLQFRSVQAQTYDTNTSDSTEIKRTVAWHFKGQSFTCYLTLSAIDYRYYKSLSKTQEPFAYALDCSSHPYLQQMADGIVKNAKALGYDDYTTIEYFIAFVQQGIPYKDDPYNNGHDYPKYPIETLVEGGGDCEDKAAVLVALLNTLEFNVVLIGFTDHMGAAVACGNCNSYFPYKGEKYSYIETTTSGWKIGELPDVYKTTGAEIFRLQGN